MDLICYLCDHNFTILSEIIEHLRKIHLVKENVDEIPCLIKAGNDYSKCTKTFKTFKGMSAHVKKCVPKIQNILNATNSQEKVIQKS